MSSKKTMSRRRIFAAAGVAGLAAVGSVAGLSAAEPQPKPPRKDNRRAAPQKLEAFRLPKGAKVTGGAKQLKIATVSGIMGVASHTFTFQKPASSTSPPGQEWSDSIVLDIPTGAGWFLSIAGLNYAFTSNDFQYLTERPLGQLEASAGIEGNNLKCWVRLSDSNSDDPVSISLTVVVVFYT